MQSSNWQAVFFDFLVAGLVIFAVFRLISLLLKAFLPRRHKKQFVLRLLPVTEMLLWIVYLSWYIFRFAEIRSLFAFVVIAMLFGLVFWISRYAARDLVAGIFFRISGRFSEGEVIVHEHLKGTIKELRLQALEVETTDGQIVYIPYSRLADSTIIKQESKDQAAAYNFILQVTASDPKEIIADRVRHFILSLPWSSTRRNPVVTIREKQGESFIAEITSYPIEKAFGRKIEQITKEHFGSGMTSR